MKIDEIKLMFEYNYWTNKLIFKIAEQITPEQLTIPTAFPFGSLFKTLLHIMDTEYGWRVLCDQGEDTDIITHKDVPDLPSLKARWETEEAEMWAYLNRLTDDDLTGNISYKVEGSGTRERVLWHCLYHLVNHGTQHRSECAAMLTDFGKSPGDIDFTLFLSER